MDYKLYIWFLVNIQVMNINWLQNRGQIFILIPQRGKLGVGSTKLDNF